MNLIQVAALLFFAFSLSLILFNLPLPKHHPDRKTNKGSIKATRFLVGIIFMAQAIITFIIGSLWPK